MREHAPAVHLLPPHPAYVSIRQHASAFVSMRQQFTFFRRIHAVQPPRREFVSEGMRPVALLHCDGKRLLYFAQALQEYKNKKKQKTIKKRCWDPLGLQRLAVLKRNCWDPLGWQRLAVLQRNKNVRARSFLPLQSLREGSKSGTKTRCTTVMPKLCCIQSFAVTQHAAGMAKASPQALKEEKVKELAALLKLCCILRRL